MSKIYGYCRVALFNVEEMQQQCEFLSKHYKIDEFFCDNGVSGLTLGDDLERLLDILQEGDIVVVKDIARLAKKPDLYFEITEPIEKAGATLIIIDLEGKEMEKKIIELNKVDDGDQCLLCCEKIATTKLKVVRPKYGDIVISFSVCDECLAQAQKDIEVCE